MCYLYAIDHDVNLYFCQNVTDRTALNNNSFDASLHFVTVS